MSKFISPSLRLKNNPVFNSKVDELIKSKGFLQFISNEFDIFRDIPYFQKLLLLVISQLNEKNEFITIKMFVKAKRTLETDPQVLSLMGLSSVEMCLIICMFRIEQKNHVGNFEIIYQEFQRFSSSVSWSLPKVMIAAVIYFIIL